MAVRHRAILDDLIPLLELHSTHTVNGKTGGWVEIGHNPIFVPDDGSPPIGNPRAIEKGDPRKLRIGDHPHRKKGKRKKVKRKKAKGDDNAEPVKPSRNPGFIKDLKPNIEGSLKDFKKGVGDKKQTKKTVEGAFEVISSNLDVMDDPLERSYFGFDSDDALDDLKERIGKVEGKTDSILDHLKKIDSNTKKEDPKPDPDKAAADAKFQSLESTIKKMASQIGHLQASIANTKSASSTQKKAPSSKASTPTKTPTGGKARPAATPRRNPAKAKSKASTSDSRPLLLRWWDSFDAWMLRLNREVQKDAEKIQDEIDRQDKAARSRSSRKESYSFESLKLADIDAFLSRVAKTLNKKVDGGVASKKVKIVLSPEAAEDLKASGALKKRRAK